MLQLIKNASGFGNKTAVVDADNEYSYSQLLQFSASVASGLLGNKPDLCQQRVAYMVNPGINYVATQWGIWRAGGVAVPIAINYPLPSIEYVIEDTEATIILADATYFEYLQELKTKFPVKILKVEDLIDSAVSKLPDVDLSRNAMILYTSGTTSKPKGVVTTHSILQSQISTLVDSWKWIADDYTICILPLHHVHGIVNVVSCGLWSGAVVQFLPTFSAEEVFRIFLEGKLNVFMAVPTIYFKLIAHFESLPIVEQEKLSEAMKKFRLMVSGSAALPVSVMEKWAEISGHYLLERYGMTEIGMGISNPYDGERRAGYIGKPLPGVKVRLVNDMKLVEKETEPGEIQVKGSNVFKEYWNKPEATKKSFTDDGWFMTGDIAVVENGYYRILGRDSVDIIKSGGYKISALEIEEVLRKHPEISDCCVVGIPDEEWGEVVAAAVLSPESDLDFKKLNDWMRQNMPAYKTPRKYIKVEELPRNAMGKVTKNDVKKIFV
ncbi:MAG: acyl-CoA synthetase [Cytophagaceae bacterium]|nr:acyl-CoA synthetase [Cytophagaceae bacterium]